MVIKLDIKLDNTVKPLLSDHSKIDKTKILMTSNSLMKGESIAECSPWFYSTSYWQSLAYLIMFHLSFEILSTLKAFKDTIKTESYADGHFNPFLASGDFCHLLITFANTWFAQA